MDVRVEPELSLDQPMAFESESSWAVSSQEAPEVTAAPWYLLYTKPRDEQVAKLHLERQGFEAYLPLYKLIKKQALGHASGAASTAIAFEPMFPRYMFARPANARQSITAMRSTRGVSTIVHFGVELAIVKPALLEAVRCAEAMRNALDLDPAAPRFKPGNKVQLATGPLSGMVGVVQLISKKRVTLLLELLGGVQRVQVDQDSLALA